MGDTDTEAPHRSRGRETFDAVPFRVACRQCKETVAGCSLPVEDVAETSYLCSVFDSHDGIRYFMFRSAERRAPDEY